jgi:aerobic C4-dicarboxylate transport protein
VRGPLYKNLTVQVLTAVAIGIAIGHFWPDVGVQLEPLSKGFINVVKMIVPPVVFLTIVIGIAKMRDLKAAGRVGLKAISYFLAVTTLALVIGMVVANVERPGSGVQSRPPTPAEKKEIDDYVAKGGKTFLEMIVPKTFVSAFTDGEMLQVLLVAILTGVAVAGLGERSENLVTLLDQMAELMFRIVAIIMKVAPLGALGAMAVTIGKFGIGSLASLAELLLGVYLTMAAFIFIVLNLICRFSGFSLFKYLAFIREEIVLVLGTSSSEAALPRMIEKLQKLGCKQTVVDMVIPAGYSFNLDGTAIYLSMAALFIAQAMHVPLSFGEQIYMLGVLMLTSKGAAAVTGGGFITLAATLGAVHPELVPGLALILGVDRFMSECRSLTNFIGNAVATIVVAKWEGALDEEALRRALGRKPRLAPAVAPSAGEHPAD